jgi:hypothetical protein
VILLEAYTNHALDKVLEGLLDKGITDIVRVGGRSKSTRLEPYNIRELVNKRTTPRSSGLQRRAATLYGKRDTVAAEAGVLAKRVNMNGGNASWIVMSEYLRLNLKNIFKELNCSHYCGGNASAGTAQQQAPVEQKEVDEFHFGLSLFSTNLGKRADPRGQDKVKCCMFFLFRTGLAFLSVMCCDIYLMNSTTILRFQTYSIES